MPAPDPGLTAPPAKPPRSLFVRIFGVVLGAVLLAQAVNAGILFLVRMPGPAIYEADEIAQALRSETGGDARLVAQVDEPPADGREPRAAGIRAALARMLEVPEDAVRVAIARPPRWALAPEPIQPPRPRSAERPPGERFPAEAPPWREDHRNGLVVGGFAAALQQPDGRWRVVRPREGRIEPWQWHVLLGLAATLVVVALFAWIIARRIARSVDLFSAAAERIGRDPAAAPLPTPAPAELAGALDALTRMQARLKRYVDDRATMLAAIAHDLRSPLMRLSLLLERAAPELRAAAFAEIRQMSQRIGDALAFVRDSRDSHRRQPLNLCSLVESVVAEAADRGEDVVLGPDDGAGTRLVVEGDVAALKAMLVNLVENAVRYGGGRARVGLRGEPQRALIEVEDDGPGIPDAELERVLEPFVRLEASRHRDTGGSGLGLASASAVARAHGGDLRLENRPGGGLTARVWLPRTA